MKIKGTLESSSKQGCLLNQVALSSPQMIWYTINSARVPGCLGNKCEVTIPAPSKFAAEQMEKLCFCTTAWWVLSPCCWRAEPSCLQSCSEHHLSLLSPALPRDAGMASRTS